MRTAGEVGALKYYRWALDILEWGRTAFKDVDRTLRGTIFDRTFVRGVRMLHLETYMKASALFFISFSFLFLPFLLPLLSLSSPSEINNPDADADTYADAQT